MDDAVRQLVCEHGRLQEAGIKVKRPQRPCFDMITHKCRADDLIPEENDTVQVALKRLSPKENYDRVFRLRRAFQVLLLVDVIDQWC